MQEKLQYLSLETTFEVDDAFDSEKFIKLKMRVCHDGSNPNGSYFSVENFNVAKTSLNNIPILAHVIVDKDGNYDFGSHDMRIVEDAFNDGSYREFYDEQPIGVVPENCDFEIKEYNEKNYVYISSYIWRGYSNYAEDIIKRDKTIKLSIEILVDKYTYDSKKDLFIINEFRFKGITLLGSNVGTGMVDTLATTESFSDKSKEALFTLMTELKEEIDKNQSSKEVEINSKFNKETEGEILDERAELVSRYNIKVEDFNLNIEELTLEDLEAKLIEFSKPQEDPKLLVFATYREKYEALRKVVNTMDSSEDYTFFYLMDFDDIYLFVEKYTYEDSGYSNSYGRITYSFNNESNTATIDGEWETIYAMWLTAEEKGKIESARTEYEQVKVDFEAYKTSHATENTIVEELVSFKNSRLTEDRKFAEEEIFTKFEKLNGNEEFETLKVNASNYELEALADKCFSILGKTTATFSISTPKKKNLVKVPFTAATQDESKNDLYDKFFDEYKIN